MNMYSLSSMDRDAADKIESVPAVAPAEKKQAK
jgi:hypothetical protein